MQQSINLIISSIIQIILVSIIPFIWWCIKDRKQMSFLRWLGFKKIIIQNKQKYILNFILVLLTLFIVSFMIIPIFVDSSYLATSQFSGQGISALIPALIYSFLQTGLSEEIFFRGFLNKRLINKFGFSIGNIIQGLLFGLLHGIMFFSITGFLGAILIIALTGFVGYLFGYINEKQSDGSIISSWIFHGCANLLASLVAMFNIIIL